MNTARRPWTGKELATLRRDYGLRPLAEICAELGRSRSSVVSQAHRLGLGNTRPPDAEARVRAMHKKGYGARRMAKELGITRQAAGQWRRRLGLPPNANDPARDRLARNDLARAMEYPRWTDYMLSRRRLRYLAVCSGCTTWAHAVVCLALKCWGSMPLGCLAERLRPVLSRQSVGRAARELTGYGVLREGEDGLEIVQRRITRRGEV